jgi:hypothetical protein
VHHIAGPHGPRQHLARGGLDYAGYSRARQARIKASADNGLHHIQLSPIHVDEFLRWWVERDDPADDFRAARTLYALQDSAKHPERLIAWPPGRNEPCSCGSGHKYKRGCAASTGPRA